MPLELSTIVIASIVLAILVMVFLVIAAYYIHRHWYYTKVILPRTKNWVFMEIQMPKDNSEDKNTAQGNEESKKNLISVAEQLFTSLSEISGRNWFFQPKEYISLEIACTDKKISFYIN